MSLIEPARKMSKSDDNERATLYVLDDPNQIKKKIGSAVTDSGSEIQLSEEKPGVSNLLTIHSSLSGISIEKLESHFLGKGYGELKAEVTELLVETLKPVRESYQELIKDKSYLDTVLKARAAQKEHLKFFPKFREDWTPERARN